MGISFYHPVRKTEANLFFLLQKEKELRLLNKCNPAALLTCSQMETTRLSCCCCLTASSLPQSSDSFPESSYFQPVCSKNF